MAYLAPVFSSANPAVDQLFGREFGVYRGEQQAQQEAAKNALISQQIQAQSQLAQAQLRAAQQQQAESNLFRMQQSKQGDRQLDIMEKDVLQRGSTKTDLDSERRKAAIIDANAAAINDAQRANSMFKINVESAVAAAKKALPVNAGLFGGNTALNLDDPKHPARRAIEKAAFDSVRNQLLAEKGGALNSLIPDADTFMFKPVQYDETGKAIALPLPTPGISPVTGQSAPAPSESPVPFTMTQPVERPAATAFGNPFSGISGLFGARSGAAPVAAPLSVKVPVPGGTLEMSSEVAAETERQLRMIAPENRAAAAGAIQDQLLKSGRARLVESPFEIGVLNQFDVQ